MAHFHFLRPTFLLLLPVLALLLWGYQRRKLKSLSWQSVCDPQLLPHLLVREARSGGRAMPLLSLALSGSLGIMALAGPAWTQLEQPVFRNRSALVLVLDLSRSMDAGDIVPSRLARARHKLIDILKKRQEGQTALVVYAAEAFVVSPLTQDTETIISQVSALKTTLMPEQGTRPDLAIQKAAQLLAQAAVPQGRILMISDGLENVPGEDLGAAVSALRKEGHRLSILGVGSAEGAPIQLSGGGFLKDAAGRIVIPQLDETALRQLAQAGGGRYEALSLDDRDIEALEVAAFSRSLEDQGEETGLKTDRWREEGPWLLLPLLPLAALAFRRGILSLLLVSALFLPRPAQALDWASLWARPDQQAAAIFEEGKTAEAAGLFEDPEWKAAAHYRSGQYEQALKALEGIESPEALYNKGNALAQMGRLPEAISAYDAVLKQNPKHEDARYNRETLKKQMKQEEQAEGEGSQKRQNGKKNQEGSEGNEDQRGSEPRDGNQEGAPSDPGRQAQSEGETKHQEAPGEQPEQGTDPGSPPNAQDNGQKSQQAEHQKSPGASSDGEEESGRAMAQADLAEADESQQAIEQWLRRIPDDPGGLLRRKFLYQSRQTPGEESGAAAW